MTGRPAILDHLEMVTRSGDGWRAICPSHDDHKPSLNIDVRGEKVLVICRACNADGVAVCRALRIDPAGDLFLGTPKSNGSGPGMEVARYRYTDERGSALYDVVRYEPKAFRQHLPGRT